MTEEWRYTEHGKLAHLLRESWGIPLDAECGLEVWNVHDWRGTGSQDEYDRIEQMPRCQRCLKAVGR